MQVDNIFSVGTQRRNRCYEAFGRISKTKDDEGSSRVKEKKDGLGEGGLR